MLGEKAMKTQQGNVTERAIHEKLTPFGLMRLLSGFASSLLLIRLD